MSFKKTARLTLPEHLVAYAAASLANILLLIPVSQFEARAGLSVDLASVGLHQLLLGVLIVLLIMSGSIARTWRWQYVVTGFLFAGYVALHLSNRFLVGLETVNELALQGASISGMIPSLYSFGLAAAGMYTGMVLAMRKAYGKIRSARAVAPSRTVTLDGC